MLISPDNTLLPSVDCGLRSISQVQLAEDIANVTLDSMITDNQLARDLTVGQPIGDQFEHFHLPLG